MQFTTDVRVRYKDTDAMGIVYHANYLVWFEVGRNELFRTLGFPYKDLEAAGFGLPVIEANCKYKKPATYDDLLLIKTRTSKLTGARIELSYQIFNKATEDLLVDGFTYHAFTNNQGRPVNIKKEAPQIWEHLTKCLNTLNVE